MPPSTRPQELSAVLHDAITRGRWKCGSELPSTRELASAHGASTATVNAALALLEEEGLILRRPNRRAIVRSPDENRRTQQVAVLVTPDAFDSAAAAPWQLTVMAGADAMLLEAGFHPVRMALWPPDAVVPAKAVTQMVEQLREKRVAGVMLHGTYPETSLFVEQMDQHSIPWICLHPVPQRPHCNFVMTDFASAGHTLGRAALASGRRRIVYLGVRSGQHMRLSPSQLMTFEGLQAAYIEAGEDNRLTRFLSCPGMTSEFAWHVMTEHLETEAPPELVVTSGDFLALGAMEACRHHRLRVPEDVAVVGGTGADIAAHAQPPLTVIAQRMTTIGRDAARCLVRAIREEVGHFPGHELPADIVVRESFPIEPAVIDELNASPVVPRQRVVRAQDRRMRSSATGASQRDIARKPTLIEGERR